jgi:hypothetical protein
VRQHDKSAKKVTFAVVELVTLLQQAAHALHHHGADLGLLAPVKALCTVEARSKSQTVT